MWGNGGSILGCVVKIQDMKGCCFSWTKSVGPEFQSELGWS